MPWHPSLNRLRDALARLYPSAAEMRRLAKGASLGLGRVALRGEPASDWQAILEEALRQDEVEELMEAALAEHRRDRALLMAVELYHQMETYPQRMGRPEGASPPSAPGLVEAAVAAPSPAEAPPLQPAGGGDHLSLDLGGGVTLALVRAPAGEFLMGSAGPDAPAPDALAQEIEMPQHRLRLLSFLIGKYPVTVAQYRAFVRATQYDLGESSALQAPDDYPVTGVSWAEARAFCEWASYAAGRAVRLPSEAEWEKAARGTDGRIYPWGNRWDAARCNNQEGGPGRPTPVGRYSPQGDSPYGCADMAGNVWEWTCSLWGPNVSEPHFGYPYRADDGREDPDAGSDVLRVVRGGAYYSGEATVRCALRDCFHPEDHEESNGFRVLVEAPMQRASE